jgi:hypothetical protein
MIGRTRDPLPSDNGRFRPFRIGRAAAAYEAGARIKLRGPRSMPSGAKRV